MFLFNRFFVLLTTCLIISCNSPKNQEGNNYDDAGENETIQNTTDDPIDPFFELKDTSSFFTVEKHTLSSSSDTFSLLLRHAQYWDDPGDFIRCSISSFTDTLLDEINSEGWVRFNENYTVPDSVAQLNSISSDKALVLNINQRKYLFLFGWVYASKPGIMTIIDLTRIPEIIFNDQFELKALKDLNNDGFVDVAGTTDFEKSAYIDLKNQKLNKN